MARYRGGERTQNHISRPADPKLHESYKPHHLVIDTRHQNKWTPPGRNGRKKSTDFSSHVEDCRKRVDTPLAADSGMHADIPAGKDPTLGSLLAEPVPIHFESARANYKLSISRCGSSSTG